MKREKPHQETADSSGHRNRKNRSLGVISALVLAAAGCSSRSAPAAAPTTSAITETQSTALPTTTKPVRFAPTLIARPCPPGYPANASCSTFTVLANRQNPTSPKIALLVAVLKATGKERQPDALVIPGGGPGFSSFSRVELAQSPFNVERDLVLYDQRGTGGAVPSLDCPEYDALAVTELQSAAPYTKEHATRVSVLNRCIADAKSAGIDLADYNTNASAADLDELRVALGYDQWNLLGVSYGARLSLATMRLFPKGIRAVILDSVYNVTDGGTAANLASAQRALDQLVSDCAASSPCVSAHGSLAVKLQKIRRVFNATPAEFDIDLKIGTGSQHFVITGDDVMSGLFGAFYDSTLIPELPGLIDDLADGNTGSIASLLQGGLARNDGLADVMAFATNCADNAGLVTHAADGAAESNPGAYGLLVSPGCPAEWPATSSDFNQPVVSDIPSLVLAGSYDPVTPPASSKRAADYLSRSTFVQVASSGHGVTGLNDCIFALQLRFLAKPDEVLDTSCATALPKPAFR